MPDAPLTKEKMHRLRVPAFVLFSLAVHGAVGVALFAHPKAPDRDPPPFLAGETFDLAVTQAPEPEKQAIVPVPAETSTTDPGATAPKPTPTATAHRPAPPSPTTNTGTAETNGSALTYGAVGDRSAIDIAVAFTRSFAQASSTDPYWDSVPFGDYGSTDVTFVLAEDGKLESWTAATTPSVALTRAIDSTVALIKGRSFVALGRTTKLHVSARISPDETHDGHYAVGGSYAGGEGNAFFALRSGRRVDVTVRPTR